MKELIRALERAAVELDFSGVVSIHEGGAAVFVQAYGERDIKNELPNTPETLFGIASGTKVFTALGIGVLIDRGSIGLDTEVGEIDPAYGGFIDERATIRHLLTHTSGIFDYYDEVLEQDFEHFTVGIPWSELETPSDYFPLYQGQPMKFRPGERYSYSNGGYVFLGMLIERLSGTTFRDFIGAHVLTAARMHRSGFHAFHDLPPNTANGYLEDRRTTNIYQLPLRGGGDGGLYTTADELAAFWDSLFANRILSAELTANYLSTHCTLSDTSGYGCGVYKHLDDSLFWIVGSDAGVGFDSRHLPRRKLTISMLSNVTDGEEGMRRVVLSHL